LAINQQLAISNQHFREGFMEQLIDNLLREFEHGGMTRRQLIQSLALAAAAAAPGATLLAQGAQKAPSMIPAAKDAAPWKTVWLDHISYAVSDYRRSAAFYRDLMGWEVKTDEGSRQATLKIGDIGEIIIRNNRQGGDAAPTTASTSGSTPAGNATAANTGGQRGNAQPRPPLTGVINHVSWGVSPWDTDKVKAELERRGLNPRPDMVGPNFKSFHVFDPDGWDLQISNQTRENHNS
jgi:catechol 2,3-dioxygenase-like lactoylglutathione lyase family enzyme